MFHQLCGRSHKTVSINHYFWRERRAEVDQTEAFLLTSIAPYPQATLSHALHSILLFFEWPLFFSSQEHPFLTVQRATGADVLHEQRRDLISGGVPRVLQRHRWRWSSFTLLGHCHQLGIWTGWLSQETFGELWWEGGSVCGTRGLARIDDGNAESGEQLRCQWYAGQRCHGRVTEPSVPQRLVWRRSLAPLLYKDGTNYIV